MKYDFSGYATKNDLKCSDGRTIRRNAFKDNDGSVVPLVWQHLHDEPENVLGHALLENREDGVYAYGVFNDTDKAQHAKSLVSHGDITSLSIYANRLSQKGNDVLHGVIREVSLVLAGANPGAYIENVSFQHSDGSEDYIDDEACIFTGSPLNTLQHAEGEEEKTKGDEEKVESKKDEEKSDETIQDVIDSMSDKQRDVMYYLVGQAIDGDEEDEEEDEGEEVAQSDDLDDQNGIKHEEGTETIMKYNVFDASTESSENAISHAEIASIVEEAKSSYSGSLKDAFIAHSITDIDVLFPEAKLVGENPALIARPNAWVTDVWNSIKKSPFARIKTTAADVTEDEARARGYIKGKQKKEEVFKLLKRVTTPKTIYKLQKLDRDDVIDITDIDVVAWMKTEMRMMLDEELCRAVLVGDGREMSSDDKINPENIRPIYQDEDLYTIHYSVDFPADADETDKSNALVDAAIRARKNYKGSGNPVFYASTDVINDMMLAKDKIGRRMYGTMTELADAIRVSRIVEVPVLEGVERTDSNSKTHELLGLIVNLNDYTVGADRGGEVSMFDDFDLNFNKYEYLLETRCSGALTKPYSAIALEKSSGASAVSIG